MLDKERSQKQKAKNRRKKCKLILLVVIILSYSSFSTFYGISYYDVKIIINKVDDYDDNDASSSYFWDNAENCHAVHNICHHNNRWFYFADSKQQQGKKQPLLDLVLDKEDYPDDIVDFRVSTMKAAPHYSSDSSCTLSPVANHVILQTHYNDMIGEFYSRTLLPLSKLIINYRSSRNETDDDYDYQEEDKNLQLYVHLQEGTLLDAHKLFLSSISSNEAKTWADMFDDPNTNDQVCRCYTRFVLCGYSSKKIVGQKEEQCRSEFESLQLPQNAKDKLCSGGFDISTMQTFINRTTFHQEKLHYQLKELGVKKRNRAKIVHYVKHYPMNVALNQPSKSSSHTSSSSSSKFAFDGNMDTRWESEYSDDQFLEVDLGQYYELSKVVIAWEVACAERYDIEVSNDGMSWNVVWSKNDGYEDMGTVESVFDNDVTARYVRMRGHKRATEWGFSIYEMQVFGTSILQSNDVSDKTTSMDALNEPPSFHKAAHSTTLVPDGQIKLVNEIECSGIEEQDTPDFMPCNSYDTLRRFLLKKLKRKYLQSNDISSYRTKLIHDNIQSHTGNNTNGVHNINHHEWKIIGLTQRIKRRRWLNLNDTINHCNTKFHSRQVICIEVTVESLPSTKTNSPLSPEYEQMLVHHSLDALIGIHGAQLTQAVLLPPHATVVELLPFAPSDYFPSGREIWGDWTQQTNAPTPLGVIYHNTDLNHLGYVLGRDSVPLCRNMSNTVMHVHSNESSRDDDEHHNETELEHCLYHSEESEFGDLFRWDERNFNVEISMIDNFIDTFLVMNDTDSNDNALSCDELREKGEKDNFVLYNVWCNDDGNGILVQHYYRD